MARKIIEQSKNFSKKDFINSRNGIALQEIAGEKLKVKSCAILLDTDEDEEEKEIGTIITDAGVYTTISENIMDSIRDIIMIEAEGETDITVNVQKRKSKQGREFLCMTID